MPHDTAITLKELSRLSGYSVSTVSKALNNKFDISLETKRVIKNLSEKYNYIPNKTAVDLRKKKTKSIALVIPKANQYYSRVIYHIEKFASDNGYRILFFQSFNEAARERKYINDINDGSVDGAIVVSKNKFLKSRIQIKGNLPVYYIYTESFKNSKHLETASINNFSELLDYIN